MDTIPAIGGLTFASDLRALGIDDRAYRRAVERGSAIRVHRGAYVSNDVWSALDDRGRYALTVRAAALASSSRPIVSHVSAAALWGVPLVGPSPSRVHVLSSIAAGTRSEGRFRRHASSRPDFELSEIDGVRLTGFDRTLVEIAAVEPLSVAVVALDWALAPAAAGRPHPTTSKPTLARCVDELDLGRSRRRAERAIEFADGRSGSPGESMSRVLIMELGFPVPELQQEFRDRRGLIGFADFWWPRANLIGEFDGVAKYVRDEFTRGQSVADMVIREKNRENRLRALGHGVVRWDWETASNPARLREQLRAAGLPSIRR